MVGRGVSLRSSVMDYQLGMHMASISPRVGWRSINLHMVESRQAKVFLGSGSVNLLEVQGLNIWWSPEWKVL